MGASTFKTDGSDRLKLEVSSATQPKRLVYQPLKPESVGAGCFPGVYRPVKHQIHSRRAKHQSSRHKYFGLLTAHCKRPVYGGGRLEQAKLGDE